MTTTFICVPCECGGHPDCPLCAARDIESLLDYESQGDRLSEQTKHSLELAAAALRRVVTGWE